MRDFQDRAFKGSDIVSISIPVSTKNIGRSCFHKCQSLASISFSPGCSVTSLGNIASALRRCLCGNPDDRCGFLEEEDGSLPTSLSKVVREHLGLDEIELEDVENYLQETDCDDQSVASSDPGDTSEDGGLQ